MFSVAMHLLHIKDLKDLSIFHVQRCYRHAGPKGPEEMFSYANDREGQAPALRARKAFSSPCIRSGSGAPELQSYLANLGNLANPAPAWHGEGQALALR